MWQRRRMATVLLSLALLALCALVGGGTSSSSSSSSSSSLLPTALLARARSGDAHAAALAVECHDHTTCETCLDVPRACRWCRAGGCVKRSAACGEGAVVYRDIAECGCSAQLNCVGCLEPATSRGFCAWCTNRIVNISASATLPAAGRLRGAAAAAAAAPSASGDPSYCHARVVPCEDGSDFESEGECVKDVWDSQQAWILGALAVAALVVCVVVCVCAVSSDGCSRQTADGRARWPAPLVDLCCCRCGEDPSLTVYGQI